MSRYAERPWYYSLVNHFSHLTCRSLHHLHHQLFLPSWFSHWILMCGDSGHMFPIMSKNTTKCGKKYIYKALNTVCSMLQGALHTVMYGSAKRHTATQQQACGKTSSRITCHKRVKKWENFLPWRAVLLCSIDKLPSGEAWCIHCPLTVHASVLSPLAHEHFICFDFWLMCWSGVGETCARGACVNFECLIMLHEKTP